ncbi:MAG: S66 peptidase family protein [Chloroflexota bacterium]
MGELKLQKPGMLKPGSRVAVVSPSWGGPGTIPARYEMGVAELRERFGLEVVEMPHTMADAGWLDKNPRARAEDVNAAFADSSIDGIITSIGGDDSVRILPYVDEDIIRANPKLFMGYSDTTTLHVFAMLAGVQTFYGPSVMSGIAENGGMFPYAERWFRRVLMSAEPIGVAEPSEEWTEEFLDWNDRSLDNRKREMKPNTGRVWLGGNSRVEGRLIGGCLDVLEFLKGTKWWPEREWWDGAIFYWEMSEEAPSPTLVKRWLRNYGSIGLYERMAGMMVGRPRGYTDEQIRELEQAILGVVGEEFGRPDMPVVTNMDFGHTEPQMIIPNGGRAVLDPGAATVTFPDAAVTG